MFPILACVRLHHGQAMKAIMATAILHTMAIEFGEDPFEVEVLQHDPPRDDFVVQDDRGPRELLLAGVQERLNVVENMAPITPCELAVLRHGRN